MKVVIDTNVFLVCVTRTSRLHWIIQCLLDEKFTLCVTTDILAEYAEILEQKINVRVSEDIMAFLEKQPNIERVNTSFRFLMIPNDPDDNKFVDCAISTGADFIVSHDTHFNILKHIPFPKVEVIDTTEFHKRLFV